MTVQFATNVYKPSADHHLPDECEISVEETAYKPSEVPDSLRVEGDTALYSGGNQKGRRYQANGDNQDDLEFEFVRG